ncbi:hypothetical protein [Vallitalea sp.]|jgi:hypothetical protein|uniref:hypothetical protein n=1 Tax=Vallitalea sp. TaxID=1882829 RepID=UPI0025D30230|nr:hypothetical protein [Vallitalea sp.]MCT4687612.1 hypothetical protein [Vallitalea sp.]
MIKIDYKINMDVINNISKSDINEISDIEGQFKISFGDNIIGYVDDEIPIYDELLVHWFSLLNKALELMNQESFVALTLPDRYNRWLLFENNENKLKVIYIERDDEGDTELIKTDKIPIKQELWHYEMNLQELTYEIARATKDCIRSILTVDDILRKAKPISMLMKYI